MLSVYHRNKFITFWDYSNIFEYFKVKVWGKRIYYDIQNGADKTISLSIAEITEVEFSMSKLWINFHKKEKLIQNFNTSLKYSKFGLLCWSEILSMWISCSDIQP